jgi:hypothetical protein
MKGIFFCEFVEMAEKTFSPELVDSIIGESTLSSDGAYTAGATYDYRELLQLVDKLSEKTGIDIDDLLIAFGNQLFEQLYANYSGFFEGSTTTFDFLGKLQNCIHSEVHKIYPDSELATFETHQPDPQTLQMTYTSLRPFGKLALGLIQGCCRHFGEEITITLEDLSTQRMNQFRFTLRKLS